jgi:hypothetical protein
MQPPEPHIAPFTIRVNKDILNRMDLVGRVTGINGDSVFHQAIELYSQIILHIAHKKQFFQLLWSFGDAGRWNLRIGEPPVSRRSRLARYLWPGLMVVVAAGAFLLGHLTA